MRYLPLTDADRQQMLSVIGAKSIDELFVDVPEGALLKELVDLPRAQGEIEVHRHMQRLAEKNTPAGRTAFFLGAGAYRHHVPASVDHLIQRSEFLTAYTPYQPEIAQGTLQALYEFQSQVATLLDMEVSNASMYDGSTACAEAAMMAARVTKRKKIVFSGGVHPHYIETARTACEALGLEIVALPAAIDDEAAVTGKLGADVGAVIVQSPNVFGTITDLTKIREAAHDAGALMVTTFTECTAFGLIEPGGSYGADIVCGEGQSIGNALNFGGPYVGLFTVKEKYLRQMPGRVAGETLDADGKRGFVLTLSTREQHIRREKATSNICTNSGLCQLAWTIHMTLLGEKGLRQLAALNHEKATQLAYALGAVPGVEVLTTRFYNEIAVRLPKPAQGVVDALATKGVIAGVAMSRLDPKAGMDDVMITCATEMNTHDDIATYADALKKVLA
ncbi:MAG: aminomethyl-transferring glycine dehydrogenase subunit GcvPA [Hyphomonadaceae bacterium JAD_PAG50586_4]|nr:MAG: aminomethyl-transferring glycine dehydrogenase subunit GcvPA [Hyphomonadaceae bacterium JAD_PAG50586_4]